MDGWWGWLHRRRDGACFGHLLAAGLSGTECSILPPCTFPSTSHRTKALSSKQNLTLIGDVARQSRLLSQQSLVEKATQHFGGPTVMQLHGSTWHHHPQLPESSTPPTSYFDQSNWWFAYFLIKPNIDEYPLSVAGFTLCYVSCTATACGWGLHDQRNSL